MGADEYLVKALLGYHGIKSGNDQNLLVYFKDHYSALVANEAYAAIYHGILGLSNSALKEDIIDKLCYARIMASEDVKDTVFDYLKDTPKSQVVELFETNQYFGADLIREYFIALKEPECLDFGKRPDAYDAAVKFCQLSYELLPDLLRRKLRDLIFALFRNGYTIANAIKIVTFGVFYNYTVVGHQTYADMIRELQGYRHYLMRMFYAEIYAATMGGKMQFTDDFSKEFTKAISEENYAIPKNKDYAEALFHNYYQLTMNNQEYELDPEDLEYIRTINPLYYR